jgi:hypothetical protein
MFAAPSTNALFSTDPQRPLLRTAVYEKALSRSVTRILFWLSSLQFAIFPATECSDINGSRA